MNSRFGKFICASSQIFVSFCRSADCRSVRDVYSCWKARSISNKNHSPNSRKESTYVFIREKKLRSEKTRDKKKRIIKKENECNRKIEMKWHESYSDVGPSDKLNSFGCLHLESKYLIETAADALFVIVTHRWFQTNCGLFHFKWDIDKGRHKVISTLSVSLFLSSFSSSLYLFFAHRLFPSLYHTHTLVSLAFRNTYDCWMVTCLYDQKSEKFINLSIDFQMFFDQNFAKLAIILLKTLCTCMCTRLAYLLFFILKVQHKWKNCLIFSMDYRLVRLFFFFVFAVCW